MATVKIGTNVSGECGSGPVVAMTREWCIYLDGKSEIAEYWSSILIVPEPPRDVPVGSLDRMDGIDVEEAAPALPAVGGDHA